jgi:hypothetical protein
VIFSLCIVIIWTLLAKFHLLPNSLPCWSWSCELLWSMRILGTEVREDLKSMGLLFCASVITVKGASMRELLVREWWKTQSKPDSHLGAILSQAWPAHKHAERDRCLLLHATYGSCMCISSHNLCALDTECLFLPLFLCLPFLIPGLNLFSFVRLLETCRSHG